MRDLICLTLIELFTSPTCQHCPAAKKVVEKVAGELNEDKENSVQLEEYDTYTETGSAKAREYGIMAVPSIFVSASATPQKVLIEGTPSKQDLLQAIEMAQGKRSTENKKNFLQKLLG